MQSGQGNQPNAPEKKFESTEYKFNKKEEAEEIEILFQQAVHKRFFEKRQPTAKKYNYQTLAEQIEQVESKRKAVGIDNALLQSRQRLNPTEEVQLRMIRLFYVKNAIALNDHNMRTVIMALLLVMRKTNCFPSVVFTIGNTKLFCRSNPTAQLNYNVLLECLDDQGNLLDIPSTYGAHTEAKSQSSSIAHKLSGLQNCDLFVAAMQEKSKTIATFASVPGNPWGPDSVVFLDHLNFLHCVIEIARYYIKFHEIPISIAQVRTLSLLKGKKITIDDAYGTSNIYDNNHKSIQLYKTNPDGTPILKQGTKQPMKAGTCSEQELYKSPFGAVTGKSIKDRTDEVKNKIRRINERYNSLKQPFSIEGRNAMRKALAENLGGDSESESSDYSDEDALASLTASLTAADKVTKYSQSYPALFHKKNVANPQQTAQATADNVDKLPEAVQKLTLNDGTGSP